VDEETDKWPVQPELQKEFDDMKPSYKVCRLPVFQNGQLVDPPDVTKALTNALAEVHFRIKHYRINRQEGAYDSFSGLVEQVIVIKDGKPKPPNAYKRKNMREGLYRPKPAVHAPALPPVQPVATAATEKKKNKVDEGGEDDQDNLSETGKDPEVVESGEPSTIAKGKRPVRGGLKATKN
jgi:hypothetical protein